MVTKARKDSAQASRSRPVNQNRKEMDRGIISSADLEELLRVCADIPDRMAAARAIALIMTSRLTGELGSHQDQPADRRVGRSVLNVVNSRCSHALRSTAVSEVAYASADLHCMTSSDCRTPFALRPAP